MTPAVCYNIACGIVSSMFLLSNYRLATDNGDEERKLLQSLRKSVISPYKKQVVCLPSNAAVGSARVKDCKTEMQSSASPRNKGSTLKLKPSPHREFASKTWTSPRRCTPRKNAVAKTRTSTPLRKTKHIHVDDRKKTVTTSRRTPNKNRSHTPRKSTKRTPAKGMLAVDNLVLVYVILQSLIL